MHNPLSDLNQIKASEELKKKTLHNVMKRKKRNPVLWGVLMVASCLILAFALPWNFKYGQGPTIASKDIYAYVSVDINPSMEFQLDKENRIIHVLSYNEDASKILDNQNLQGLSMDEAFTWLLDNEQIQVYMKDGFMQVSVYSDDAAHSSTLEQDLDTSLSKLLDSSQYGCSCASKEEHQAASDHHMSFGKYQLIESILAMDESYTLNDLQNMNMRDLNILYESMSGTTYPQGHQGNGNHQGQGNGNGQGNHHNE